MGSHPQRVMYTRQAAMHVPVGAHLDRPRHGHAVSRGEASRRRSWPDRASSPGEPAQPGAQRPNPTQLRLANWSNQGSGRVGRDDRLDRRASCVKREDPRPTAHAEPATQGPDQTESRSALTSYSVKESTTTISRVFSACAAEWNGGARSRSSARVTQSSRRSASSSQPTRCFST